MRLFLFINLKSTIRIMLSNELSIKKFLLTAVVIISFICFGAIGVASSAKAGSLISGKEVSGESIVNEARKYIGKLRYSFGGTSLKYGCDCSGFVCAIYKTQGINLFGVRSSYAMYGARNAIGKSLGSDTSKAKDGDIVIYGSHAAIATDKGTVVNCQNSGCMEQTHAYMRRYFGPVKAVIRVSLVKNLEKGDVIKDKKSNSKFEVVST